jgi:hypothetical protein
VVSTLSTTELVPLVVVAVELAALITFLVLFLVGRRQLTATRHELERI